MARKMQPFLNCVDISQQFSENHTMVLVHACPIVQHSTWDVQDALLVDFTSMGRNG